MVPLLFPAAGPASGLCAHARSIKSSASSALKQPYTVRSARPVRKQGSPGGVDSEVERGAPWRRNRSRGLPLRRKPSKELCARFVPEPDQDRPELPARVPPSEAVGTIGSDEGVCSEAARAAMSGRTCTRLPSASYKLFRPFLLCCVVGAPIRWEVSPQKWRGSPSFFRRGRHGRASRPLK